MKRYASHFLFLPGHGYLKQYVVEIGEGQCVSRIFPLTEEVENTEWLPGVIALLTEAKTDYSLRLMSASTSFPMPFPSLPITISPFFESGCPYIFSPSRKVP